MSEHADTDRLKQAVAEAAVERVASGMVVGLGSGTTAELVIRRLGERVRAGLDIAAIPTSRRSAALARAEHIRVVEFATHPRLDLTIDGADQVDRRTLVLIKGRGGALLREKIVAVSSDRLVIVVDASKLTDRLAIAVPVEVVRFGLESTMHRIARLGATPARRMHGTVPFLTDGGNGILDCDFGPIAQPAALEDALRGIVGVIETGLFIGLTEEVLVADATGVRSLANSEADLDGG